MVSRRSALKTALGVALAARAGTSDALSAAPAATPDRPLSGEYLAQTKESELLTHVAATTTVEKPHLGGVPLYSSRHPLAQGEVVTLPWLRMEVEEVSTRLVPIRRPKLSVRMREHANVEDLLRVRLEDEAPRLCAEEWADYKFKLHKVEHMLLAAGVDGETAKCVIDDLDCAAVGLHVTGVGQMLKVGIEAGKALAKETQPSLLFLRGDRTCKACFGSGGNAQDCATCEGTGLVDEPGPSLGLVILPDDVPLEEVDVEHAAA